MYTGSNTPLHLLIRHKITPFGKVIVLVQQQLTKYEGHIESYHVEVVDNIVDNLSRHLNDGPTHINNQLKNNMAVISHIVCHPVRW